MIGTNEVLYKRMENGAYSKTDTAALDDNQKAKLGKEQRRSYVDCNSVRSN